RVVVLFVLCVPLAHAQMESRPPLPRMRAHYINVGQGDAILLELPHAAVLIDAGGEETFDFSLRNRLLNYLEAVFKERPDLHHTIDAIIISHPHIDHTRLLVDVMKTFTVRNLIDGGEASGSGIGPLKQARQMVGKGYFPVKDTK